MTSLSELYQSAPPKPKPKAQPENIPCPMIHKIEKVMECLTTYLQKHKMAHDHIEKLLESLESLHCLPTPGIQKELPIDPLQPPFPTDTRLFTGYTEFNRHLRDAAKSNCVFVKQLDKDIDLNIPPIIPVEKDLKKQKQKVGRLKTPHKVEAEAETDQDKFENAERAFREFKTKCVETLKPEQEAAEQDKFEAVERVCMDIRTKRVEKLKTEQEAEPVQLEVVIEQEQDNESWRDHELRSLLQSGFGAPPEHPEIIPV